MKRGIFLILSLSVCLSYGLDAEFLIQKLGTNSRSLALQTIQLLPEKQRNGIETYLQLIGVQTSSIDNVGFNNYSSSLLTKNICFQKMAAQFYNEIRQEDLTRILLKKNPALLLRPSLQHQNSLLDLDDGWLWKKAMKIAQGNSTLAVHLIGVCGHDEYWQIKNPIFLNTPLTNENINSWDDEFIHQNFEKTWKQLSFFEQKLLPIQQLQRMIKFYQLSQNEKKSMLCPTANSSMYYSKALDVDMDISFQLKQKILQIQAPNAPNYALAAKNYHILGSAFASCQLIKANIPHWIAERMVKGAANAYRAGNLCRVLTNPINSKIAEKTFEEFRKDIRQIQLQPSICYPILPNGRILFSKHKESWSNSACFAVFSLPQEWIIEKSISDELLHTYFDRIVANKDILDMFSKTSYFQDANSCLGDQLNEGLKNFLESSALLKTEDCPQVLSKERCEKAIKRIKTYLVDFEWTTTQHLLGLEFAKKYCKIDLDIENLSCANSN